MKKYLSIVFVIVLLLGGFMDLSAAKPIKTKIPKRAKGQTDVLLLTADPIPTVRVATPRPYNRMYQLTGTKGFANKYPVQGYAFSSGQVGADITADHEKLDGHSFVKEDVRKALMEKYKFPFQRELESLAKKVGGHGGMDFLMDYRLIYCLQKGLPLDMDVYDLAEWCCLIPLTEISLKNGSVPVEIPDFTRGAWDKIEGLKFAE